MAYTETLSADFGSHVPTLGDVRVTVDGQTISAGIAAIPDTNGSGFQVTVTNLTDGFSGPFVFYDNADPAKYAVGSVSDDRLRRPVIE